MVFFSDECLEFLQKFLQKIIYFLQKFVSMALYYMQYIIFLCNFFILINFPWDFFQFFRVSFHGFNWISLLLITIYLGLKDVKFSDFSHFKSFQEKIMCIVNILVTGKNTKVETAPLGLRRHSSYFVPLCLTTSLNQH